MASDPALQPSRLTPPTERQEHILDAAERCFARSGFHRTTMQDVASEAGMSPGNLYRYFASKDAMVAGLTERNRAQMRAEFEGLANAPDFMAAFAAMGRKYFQDDPREKTLLCLEMWAEATHNPAYAKMHAEFERECAGNMIAAFRQAQARGQIPAGVDIDTVELIVALIADGLMVRRSLSPNFDSQRDVKAAVRVIGALLRGEVTFTSPSSSDPSR